MSLISSVSPNGTFSGPVPNVPTQALAQANVASDTNPIARSLLPSAIASARIIPSYAPETRPVKATLRNLTTPSTALAAQLIAQEPQVKGEQLILFAPRGELKSFGLVAGEDARALSSLRIERGEINPAIAPVIVPVPLPEPGANANAIATSAATDTKAEEAALTYTADQTPAPEARSSTATTTTVKKSSIAQARGATAYQLADIRPRVPVPSQFEAILS